MTPEPARSHCASSIDATHDMRIGYYNDTYVRTEAGWRIRTRKMTFIRRSGEHDSGIPHAFERPGA